MKCPECGNFEDKVVETRESKEGSYIRRRRECLRCGKRFTTYEKVENIPLLVAKKDGRREEFDLDKVRKGLYRAVEKRPIPIKQIEQIARHVEEMVSNSEKEITTNRIGEYIMGKLKALDKVAYVRFASVYLDFRSLEEFLSELHNLMKKEE
ncbi:MAG: transcriptional repressor NrdR [Candidatus Aminicenantes bacterium]|nr:transcriptional repressor NrdR [Candidatus Aminicenantes bacterium]NIM79063.1 transcriptional repressor NrdR [Candidatus Aminicenantes bacterium]NIN18342.1 transcriptional repressor NrdR [Candidatus Aminicenantes bacterium]NIN42229.1 transcriptional repressor NrdR [Candidatus Aminicenantes bacterium]NIN84995.1 transcriptional repressor NrdR [Candidatus Aminicenantes bacterium]